MTFSFGNNLWFALDRPATWVPPLTGVPGEMCSAVQRDPLLIDRAQGDSRLQPASPAEGGVRGVMPPIPGDFAGRCFAAPPSIGAFER
ncbi:MAG: hypothetical protein SFW67_10830 [Myxococcaceae bacterium]|nr:hypothetical protein [Myxococcaceae bacterium]